MCRCGISPFGGSRVAEVVRALPSHKCVLGSIPSPTICVQPCGATRVFLAGTPLILDIHVKVN